MASTTFSVFTQFKALDKISAPLKKIESSASHAKKTFDKLRGTMQFIGGAIAFGAITAGLKNVINLGVELDKTLMDVGSKLNFSSGSEAYDRLNKKAKEVGSSTIFSTSEVARAFDFLAMAGFDTVESLEANIDSLAILAQAAGLGLDRATDIASDVMGMWNISMQQVGDVMAKTANTANTSFEALFESYKNVGPVANAFGASIEETSAALALLANQGIKGSAAGNKLKTIMANLSGPTGRTAEALAEFGIQTMDAQGNMLSLEHILKNIEDVYEDLGGAGSGAALELLNNIAGKEASAALAALMNSGSDEFAKLRNMLEGSQGAAAEMAEIKGESVEAKLNAVASKIGDLKLSMWDSMKNGYQSMLIAIYDSLSGLTIGFEALGKVFGTIFTLLGYLMRFFGNLLQDINAMPTPLKILSVALIGLVTGFYAVIKGIALFKKAMLAMQVMMMTNPVGLVIIGIIALIAILYVVIRYWDKLKEKFMAVFGGIGSWIYTYVIEPIKNGATWLWNAIVDGLKWLVKMWIAYVTFVVKIWIAIFKGIWTFTKKYVIDPIIKGLKWLVKMWIAYVTFIVKIWIAIFKGIWTFTQKYVIDPIVTGFFWLWDMVLAGVQWLWNGIKFIFSTIWNWIKSYVITPMTKGFAWLWEGILAGVHWLWNGAKMVFGAIWDWIDEHVITPISKGFLGLWDGITTGWDKAWEGLKTALSSVAMFFEEYVVEPIVKLWDNMWNGIKNLFGKNKTEMASEIDDLAVQHNVNQTLASSTTVGGSVDINVTGQGQVTNTTSSNPNVPLNTQNRGSVYG